MQAPQVQRQQNACTCTLRWSWPPTAAAAARVRNAAVHHPPQAEATKHFLPPCAGPGRQTRPRRRKCRPGWERRPPRSRRPRSVQAAQEHGCEAERSMRGVLTQRRQTSSSLPPPSAHHPQAGNPPPATVGPHLRAVNVDRPHQRLVVSVGGRGGSSSHVEHHIHPWVCGQRA